MKCDFCPNDANIEIVVFIDGKAQKVRMCSSCYKERLQEMMQNMPQEWGGVMLSEQLKAMLERAEENGFIGGMEFKVTRGPMENAEAYSVEMKSQNKAFADISNNMFNQRKEEEPRSARDLAFDEQLKSLRRQRAKLMQELELALAQEEYEKCAGLRDDLAKIGDDLVKMNEERKNPYGV